MEKKMKKVFRPSLLFLIIPAFILIGMIIAILFYTGILWFVHPAWFGSYIYGIDVSHHQGEIDWSLVKKGPHRFVIIKATEGDDFVDDRFAQNWAEAQRNHLVVGAYHFYSLRFSGQVQAENFCRTVPYVEGMLPPVIDLEYGGNSKIRPEREEFWKELETFIEIVKKKYGRPPLFYVTYQFYKDYIREEYDYYDIWIRDIFKYPDKSVIKKWTIWQYKHRGHVKGIKGYVDLNVFNGNEEAFQKYLID